MQLPFHHQLRIRYAECDAQGIVFNANWFVYFDTVVTELWRELMGGYQLLVSEHGVETVVAETGARFRAPARFDDLVDFTVTVPRIGDRSMRVEVTASREQTLLVEGFLEYVFVDTGSFQSVELPTAIRSSLTLVAEGE